MFGWSNCFANSRWNIPVVLVHCEGFSDEIAYVDILWEIENIHGVKDFGDGVADTLKVGETLQYVGWKACKKGDMPV